MGWVTPERVRGKYDAELLGTNELFDLLRWKQNILAGVMGKSRFGSYRIVLRAPTVQFIVAAGKTIEEVQPQWKIVEDTIMPDIRKYNANDSQTELCEYLLVKCDSFARLQQLEETERQCEEFNQIFGFKGEQLVSMYNVSLWKRTPIELYLSENYICIRNEEPDSQGEHDMTIITWKQVTAIRKRKCLARDTAISVHYTTHDKSSEDLFIYGFSQRDEVAGIMDQLWQNLMSKVLRSAENNTSLVHDNASTRRASGNVKNVADKMSLESNHAHSAYNRKFRLPTEEKHLSEFPCRTWEGSGFKTGKMYISKHFLCFQTTKGKDVRIVIPFREMKGVTKENHMLGVRSKAIKVSGRYRRYLFVFDSPKERNSSYNAVVDKWNRALGECNLLSFTEVPVDRKTPIGMMNLQNDLKEFSEDYLMTQKRIEGEWDEYFKKHGKKTGMAEDYSHLFLLLKQGGVPDSHRPWAWPLLSGANYKANCAPYLGYYSSLLQQDIDPDVYDEIKKDIHRSFPEHQFFQSPEGIQCLEDVLRAYAVRNPAVGYCQSMNIITALLLVYLPNEWAFWVLAAICEDLVPENYGQHMIGSIVDQSTFEELLTQALPRVASHLQNIGVQIGMITQGWFICLFIGYLPLEISLQVLDMFFFLRGRMQYAVGLAVFKCYETEILNMYEADEVVVYLRDLHFCPDLLKTTFKYLETLDTDSIEEMKNAGKYEVIKAMEKTTKNSAIRAVQEKGTKFEMPELYQIYNIYQRIASPDTFTVDESQFNDILIELVPWIEWRADLMKPLFHYAGKGKDTLSFVEVALILSNCCKGTLREKLAFYFQLHDTKNEERLDEGDYYKALDALVRSYYNEKLYEADLRTLVSWTFTEADTDKDDKITLEEICTLLLPSAASGGDVSTQEEDDAQLGLLRHFLQQ